MPRFLNSLTSQDALNPLVLMAAKCNISCLCKFVRRGRKIAKVAMAGSWRVHLYWMSRRVGSTGK